MNLTPGPVDSPRGVEEEDKVALGGQRQISVGEIDSEVVPEDEVVVERKVVRVGRVVGDDEERRRRSLADEALGETDLIEEGDGETSRLFVVIAEEGNMRADTGEEARPVVSGRGDLRVV